MIDRSFGLSPLGSTAEFAAASFSSLLYGLDQSKAKVRRRFHPCEL